MTDDTSPFARSTSHNNDYIWLDLRCWVNIIIVRKVAWKKFTKIFVIRKVKLNTTFCSYYALLATIHYFFFDLITFLSIYLLANLHLSQTVGEIRLNHGKEIRPIPLAQVACPRNWRVVWHVCSSSALCPTLKMFLVKLVFSRYFRKFFGDDSFLPLRWLKAIQILC